MADYPLSPNLALKRPVVGSGQAWSTQKYIVDNMDAIDAFAGAVDGRLDKVEAEGGSTAVRDAKFGVPSTAGERVALAAKGATFFNTDKGWLEQYFAAYNDAGVGNAPARPAAGWAPAVAMAPIRGGVLTQDAGTFTRKGDVYEFSGVNGGMKVAGLLVDDFEHYRIQMEFDSATIDGDVGLQLWNGGASIGSVWQRNYIEITAGASSTLTATSAQATATIGRLAGTGGGQVVAEVFSPKKARTTFVQARSIDRTNYQRIIAAHTGTTTTACDGIEFRFSGGMTVAGKFRVFGISS